MVWQYQYNLATSKLSSSLCFPPLSIPGELVFLLVSEFVKTFLSASQPAPHYRVASQSVNLPSSVPKPFILKQFQPQLLFFRHINFLLHDLPLPGPLKRNLLFLSHYLFNQNSLLIWKNLSSQKRYHVACQKSLTD